jgi:hypothetical protein
MAMSAVPPSADLNGRLAHAWLVHWSIGLATPPATASGHSGSSDVAQDYR